MNKDIQEFEKWWWEGFKGMSDMDIIKYGKISKHQSEKAWEAACQYKQEEIRHLKNELQRLTEALEFYADESHLEMKYAIGNEGNYPLGEYWNDTMCSENGRTAREALAKVKYEG